MTELVEVLDRLAVRGMPRGADAVFDAAVQAASRTAMVPSVPDSGTGSDNSSIEVVEFDERSTSRNRHRKTASVVVALLAVAGVLAVIAVVRWPDPVHQASPPADESAPSTSPSDTGPMLGVPALSSSIDSKPTATAAAFGSYVAGILAARDGTAPDLRETATRTTDRGQVVEYAYFGQTGRRLFVLSGGPNLISSVPGLLDQLASGPQTVTGSVVVWPETAWKRTVALTTADSVLIISSEAIDQTGSASSISELVDLATKLSAFNAFASLPLGAPQCSPPSPIIGNEFRGTSNNAQLSGLIFATKTEMRVGDDIKLVIRMTGSGSLTITATAPDGTSTTLDSTAHTGSTFDRPGDEWDTSITYAQAGCWQIHLARTDSSADVYFQVSA